mmetsp:Transcript_23164/g.50625  ORF Transcript_23164/g.50625 Transcript_23164/m.50625 type:complete len:261 (+) Transcript_23164:1361-2143(+)
MGSVAVNSVHDAALFIQLVDNGVSDPVDRRRVQHDFVVLRHVDQKLVHSRTLCVPPPAFAIPRRAHQRLFEIQNQGVGDGNIVGYVWHLGPVRQQLLVGWLGDSVDIGFQESSQANQLAKLRRGTVAIAQSPDQNPRRDNDTSVPEILVAHESSLPCRRSGSGPLFASALVEKLCRSLLSGRSKRYPFLGRHGVLRSTNNAAGYGIGETTRVAVDMVVDTVGDTSSIISGMIGAVLPGNTRSLLREIMLLLSCACERGFR